MTTRIGNHQCHMYTDHQKMPNSAILSDIIVTKNGISTITNNTIICPSVVHNSDTFHVECVEVIAVFI